jgi:hypothetical protein
MKKGVLGLAFLLSISLIPAYSATPPKAGSICSKQGLVSKGLACEKVKGKLVWTKSVVKNDQFTLNLPTNQYLDQGQLQIAPTALSGKKMRITSETDSICSISEQIITPLSPGRCILRASTIADKKFKAKSQSYSLDIRSSNSFEMNVEGQYRIDQVVPDLMQFSSAGLPIEYTSETTDVCQVSGTKVTASRIGLCIISGRQLGNLFVDSAAPKVARFKVIRNNVLTFALPDSILLSAKTSTLSGISSTGLAVAYKSISPEICNVSTNILTLLQHGNCLVEASQAGDDFTLPAEIVTARIKVIRENEISFSNPGNLSLKVKSVQLSGVSSSGLTVIYKTMTPNTCLVSNNVLSLLAVGTCTIVASQSGDEFTLAAKEVSQSFILSNDRVLSDQPDSLTGYQIKAIYVVPSDGTDRSYDTNGYIASILREGNTFIKSQIGREYQIDSVGNDYDIQFFRSAYPTSYFLSADYLDSDLAKEMKLYENPTLERKNYHFFVDVSGLRNDKACGYASKPGLHAVNVVGPSNSATFTCVGKSLNLDNYGSHIWVHESFHNLGVDHTTDDGCDFMRGSGSCSSTWTIDKERKRYVGSDAQGVNILTLRVWKDYTTDQSLRASCTVWTNRFPRADGLKYAVCPTGKQVIGALTYCWSSIRSVDLQVWRNNSWESLGEGNHYREPWGKHVDWSCDSSTYTAPWKEITVTTPGIQKYRWMINGSEGEVFNIIWQR